MLEATYVQEGLELGQHRLGEHHEVPVGPRLVLLCASIAVCSVVRSCLTAQGWGKRYRVRIVRVLEG